jgi:hypothetical protein
MDRQFYLRCRVNHHPQAQNREHMRFAQSELVLLNDEVEKVWYVATPGTNALRQRTLQPLYHFETL